MEINGKLVGAFCAVIFLMISTCMLTYFVVSSNKQTCSRRIVMDDNLLKFTKEGTVDLIKTFRVPEKGLTITKGVAGGRCFVLTNDLNPSTELRTLSVLESEMSSEQLEALGGAEAANFCAGLTIVPVQHFDQDPRTRRQAAKPAENPNAGAVTNECAQRVIVQCANDTSVYKCVSGPKEAYRAKITCNNANQFTFDLTTRCKEFENTQTDRYAKCLEKIILNQQGKSTDGTPRKNQ